MFRSVIGRLAPVYSNIVRGSPNMAKNQPCLSNLAIRKASNVVVLSDEQKDEAWMAYFDNPDLDYYDFCLGFMDLWQEDAIPEPVILQSALYACRRLNSLPAAVRCLELVRVKCRDKKEIYDYVIQELGPTFNDLGLKTPEQLGLDQVSD